MCIPSGERGKKVEKISKIVFNHTENSFVAVHKVKQKFIQDLDKRV